MAGARLGATRCGGFPGRTSGRRRAGSDALAPTLGFGAVKSEGHDESVVSQPPRDGWRFAGADLLLRE